MKSSPAFRVMWEKQTISPQPVKPYTFYTRSLSRVAAPRRFFGRSLGLGVVGRKGTEKNGAPVWSTDTLDFVVFLNVLAPLDSDRKFSPKIALNG